MASRTMEIKDKYMRRGDDTVAILNGDYLYLLRMAKALEDINEEQQKVNRGVSDGLDFAVAVEDILQKI